MARHEETRTPEAMLPLRPIDLQMLLVLLEHDLHGYGLMKEVESQSGGKVTLEVGSLYRVIKRLLASGLIEEAGQSEASAGAKPRINYRITPFGREVAQAEAARLVGVVATARERQLIEGR
jgi:DNA-binding PadR family transcriptional regulator